MMFRGTFQAKDPAGKISLPFDFGADLGGETISSATTAITLDAGDETGGTTLTTNGIETVTGGVVYVPVKDGAKGCDYVVKVLATTSGGRVLPLAGLLPVRLA